MTLARNGAYLDSSSCRRWIRRRPGRHSQELRPEMDRGSGNRNRESYPMPNVRLNRLNLSTRASRGTRANRPGRNASRESPSVDRAIRHGPIERHAKFSDRPLDPRRGRDWIAGILYDRDRTAQALWLQAQMPPRMSSGVSPIHGRIICRFAFAGSRFAARLGML